jgi:hypothetical protein
VKILSAEQTTPEEVTPSAAQTRSDHRSFFHWLPWVLPLLAIATPEFILVLVSTAQAGHWTLGTAATSIDRGDLLIPVAIVCAEAWRRWFDKETKITNYLIAGLAGFFGIASGVLGLICVGAAIVVFSDPTGQGDPVISIPFTWAALACGFIGGTIAVGVSDPRRRADG